MESIRLETRYLWLHYLGRGERDFETVQEGCDCKPIRGGCQQTAEDVGEAKGGSQEVESYQEVAINDEAFQSFSAK